MLKMTILTVDKYSFSFSFLDQKFCRSGKNIKLTYEIFCTVKCKQVLSLFWPESRGRFWGSDRPKMHDRKRAYFTSDTLTQMPPKWRISSHQNRAQNHASILAKINFKIRQLLYQPNSTHAGSYYLVIFGPKPHNSFGFLNDMHSSLKKMIS